MLIIILLLASLLLGCENFFSTQPAITGVENSWIIQGNKVFINDSRVLLSAEPHTLRSSGYVYEDLVSKVFEGDITVVYGFDTDLVKPRRLELYKPRNVTIEKSYTCDYNFNYTLNPKYAWCYKTEQVNIGTNSSPEWVERNVTVFEHGFESGDLGSKTISWTETRHEDWIDVSKKFNKVSYDYGGMDTWYYVSGVNIEKDKLYRTRVYLEVIPRLGSFGGKYWRCVMPSSYGKDVRQANLDGKLYCLDPWWNTTFKQRYNITINNTDGISHENEIIKLNISGTGCAVLPNSTRLYDAGTSTEVNFSFYNASKEAIVFIMNKTVASGGINTDYALYCNATGVSEANTSLFEGERGYSDFEDSSLLGWTTDYTSISSSYASEGNRSLYFNDNDPSSVTRDFYNLSNVGGYEIETIMFDFMIEGATEVAYFALVDSISTNTWYTTQRFSNAGDFEYFDGSTYNTQFAVSDNVWYSVRVVVNWTSDTAKYCYQETGSSDWVCDTDSIRTAGSSTDANYFVIQGSNSGTPDIYIDRFSVTTGNEALRVNQYLNSSNITLGSEENQALPPVVILNSPKNNTWTSDNTPDFNFTAISDSASTLNCTLWINNSMYGTNSSVINNTATIITANHSLTYFTDYDQSIFINCSDGTNTNTSKPITLYVYNETGGLVSCVKAVGNGCGVKISNNCAIITK